MQEVYSKIAHSFRQEMSGKAHYPMPPLKLIQFSGSSDIPHYVDNMLLYTGDIIEQCMLKRNSRVLELGCGAGRVANALVNYLDVEGSYVGLDVNEEIIAWCHRDISVRNANFEFYQVNIANNYYYDTDNQQQNSYDFSFLKDDQFDCVIALSLFNHLKLEDARQYLTEIGKRLNRNGVAYLTFFVIDDYFHAFREKTKIHLDLYRTEEGMWHGYERQSFFAGYEEPLLENLFQEAGLTVLTKTPGSWVQKPHARIYQDWYLVTGSS